MDTSPNQTQNPAQKNMVMGILAYLGILVIVPFIVSKDDPFVKFHVKQGFVLLSIEVIVWILGSVVWGLWMLLSLVNLAVVILSIVGIVNVVQGQEKKLPIVGDFSRYFTF